LRAVGSHSSGTPTDWSVDIDRRFTVDQTSTTVRTWFSTALSDLSFSNMSFDWLNPGAMALPSIKLNNPSWLTVLGGFSFDMEKLSFQLDGFGNTTMELGGDLRFCTGSVSFVPIPQLKISILFTGSGSNLGIRFKTEGLDLSNLDISVF